MSSSLGSGISFDDMSDEFSVDDFEFYSGGSLQGESSNAIDVPQSTLCGLVNHGERVGGED